MAGIAGILALDHTPIKSGDTIAMARALPCHGEEETGLYRAIDANFAMIMRHGADQKRALDAGDILPFSNELRDIWLAIDGRILNEQSLRHGLKMSGHWFRGSNDGETAVHAYEDHGPQFLAHLRGMFALALWDESRERLILARDPIGEKSLYYARDGHNLVFASHIRAILAIRPHLRLIDARALSYYLSFGFVPAPLTLFTGIRKLAAGEMLMVDKNSKIAPTRYRPLVKDESKAALIGKLPLERHMANLRALAESAVADRLDAEGDRAILLSDGLCSAIAASLASRLSGRCLDAFTIRYEDKSRSGKNEPPDTTALPADLRPHIIHLDQDKIWPLLTEAVAGLEEPMADPLLISLWAAGVQCRAGGFDAAMTGEGLNILLRNRGRHRPLRQILKEWIGTRNGREANNDGADTHDAYFSARLKETVATPAWRSGMTNWPAHAFHDSMKDGICDKIPHCLCTHEAIVAALVDRTMQLSDGRALYNGKVGSSLDLDLAAPFLDETLVDYAALIPAGLLKPHGQARSMIWRAFADLVPDGLFHSAEPNAPLPVDKWFADKIGDRFLDQLSTNGLIGDGILSASAIITMLADHRAGKAFHGRVLWSLLILAQWYESFEIHPAQKITLHPVAASMQVDHADSRSAK